MAVGAVVGHEIENELEAAPVRLFGQAVHVRERAEEGIDIGVVGDVIAEIGHRRGIDRRDPDRIDTEPDEMIEPRQDAGQIADAVAIRVLKGARIDLIEDPALPPDRRAHGVLTELHNSGRSSL